MCGRVRERESLSCFWGHTLKVTAGEQARQCALQWLADQYSVLAAVLLHTGAEGRTHKGYTQARTMQQQHNWEVVGLEMSYCIAKVLGNHLEEHPSCVYQTDIRMFLMPQWQMLKNEWILRIQRHSVIHFSIYSCAFPTVRCQCVFIKK